MSINALAAAIHEAAKEKGWWSRPADNVASKLLMIHAEVSEAAEDLRMCRADEGNPAEANYADLRHEMELIPFSPGERRPAKPSGFPSEIADIIIRTLDVAARVGIDIEAVIAKKMAYNATRAERHGGKLC